MIGILQPRKSFFIDILFGGILGIFRGYIVFILLVFFINTNFTYGSIPKFVKNGALYEIVNYGIMLLEQMPRNIEEIDDLNI